MLRVDNISQINLSQLQNITLADEDKVKALAKTGLVEKSHHEKGSITTHKYQTKSLAKKIAKKEEVSSLKKLSSMLGVDLSQYEEEDILPTCMKIYYKDGSCYTGLISSENLTQTISGIPRTTSSFFHYFGKMEYSDGSSYLGEWSHGKRHGKGSLVDSKGTICKGIWNRGNLHGAGSLTRMNNPCPQYGIWSNNIFIPKGSPIASKLPKPLLPLSTTTGLNSTLLDPKLTLFRPQVIDGVQQNTIPKPSENILANILCAKTVYLRDTKGKPYVENMVMQIHHEDGTIIKGRYTGPLDKNGRAHSTNGIFYGEDGSYYEGAFVKGRREGKGLSVLPNGDNVHGIWKAGFLSKNKIKIIGKLDPTDDSSEIVTKKGYHAKGSLVKTGTLILASGEKIQGKWHKNGMGFEGSVLKYNPETRQEEKGTFTVSEGFQAKEKKYSSRVEDITLSVEIDTSYKSSKPPSKIRRLIQSSLVKEEGEYRGEVDKKGRAHGNGTFTFDDGSQYIGKFKDGRFHGSGRMVNENSTQYGFYNNGRLQRANTSTRSHFDPNNNSTIVTRSGTLNKSRTHLTGNGMLMFPSGETISGMWDSDGLFFEGTCTLSLPSGEKQDGILGTDGFFPLNGEEPISKPSTTSYENNKTALKRAGFTSPSHGAKVSFDTIVNHNSVGGDDFSEGDDTFSLSSDSVSVQEDSALRDFSHVSVRKPSNLFDKNTSKLLLGIDNDYSPSPETTRSFPNTVINTPLNGGFYSGQLGPTGKAHGFGRIMWSDNVLHEDYDIDLDVLEDPMSEYYHQHVLYYAESQYEGKFRKGKFHGMGTFSYKDSVIHKGSWFKGIPIITQNTDASAITDLKIFFPQLGVDCKDGYYVGAINSKNRPEGKGRFYYAKHTKPTGLRVGHSAGAMRGYIYDGDWEDGVKHGDGTLYTMSEEKADRRGIYWEDCVIYEGTWIDGLPEVDLNRPISTALSTCLETIQDNEKFYQNKGYLFSDLSSPHEFIDTARKRSKQPSTQRGSQSQARTQTTPAPQGDNTGLPVTANDREVADIFTSRRSSRKQERSRIFSAISPTLLRSLDTLGIRQHATILTAHSITNRKPIVRRPSPQGGYYIAPQQPRTSIPLRERTQHGHRDSAMNIKKLLYFSPN
ncbi:MAG: hypothetical protein ACRCV3_03635 [Desulfovibrionaceae bacterium]